ncbi:TetR/AcrR family transcriptional regulator [Dyadobacter sp. NIV53]|uniref:TetR/AcrR family transcriptional regulator n=1 Tax=Dyadobacter sp. NIV53 TaxID=2861765 RepID=UPI001C877642|nr:TetR/AcrR family transcriptional regulator [Dyadobacter sp. NIV53]
MARNVEFNEETAIQKAMEVFWKKGYNGASMRDLTDAMQINPSSLYNTIGDKRQLFVKCIQNYTESRMEEAKVHSAKIKSPLKAITSFVNDSVNAILYSSNSCLAIKTTFELAATDKDVQGILRKDSDFTHEFLLSLVKSAVKQNEIDPDTDAEMITDYIINSFTGWHESYILHQDANRIKKMAKYLIAQISR